MATFYVCVSVYHGLKMTVIFLCTYSLHILAKYNYLKLELEIIIIITVIETAAVGRQWHTTEKRTISKNFSSLYY